MHFPWQHSPQYHNVGDKYFQEAPQPQLKAYQQIPPLSCTKNAGHLESSWKSKHPKARRRVPPWVAPPSSLFDDGGMNAPEQTPRPSLQSQAAEAGGATRPQHFAMMETSMCETYAQCTKIPQSMVFASLLYSILQITSLCRKTLGWNQHLYILNSTAYSSCI